MDVILGIRKEDKNQWERRVPLTPSDVAELQKEGGMRFLVQTSPIRVFTDSEYSHVGAEVVQDLSPASLVLAVKEIPIRELRPERTYVFFAHVIKGQPYNMPMLQHLLDSGCSLVDYERIVDEHGRRLIFFGVEAGQAGAIETLWALGQRLKARGVGTPLSELRHAYEYENLAAAKEHLRAIGQAILEEGPGHSVSSADAGRTGNPGETGPEPGQGFPWPPMIGVAGYGNVARGCQEILDCLPVGEIPAAQLQVEHEPSPFPFLKVTFGEEDMVAPAREGAAFELQDYYQHPEKYVGRFEDHLPHLDVLLNTIYWDERYPRLVTREWARANYGPGRDARLQVIGDISCDVEGSIELTLKTTAPDEPCFVYDPVTDSAMPGVEGNGPVIMAVDNLPCELAREASERFSHVLRAMVPDLAGADWNKDFEALELPPHLKRAVIVHRGRLTPDYEYLTRHLDADSGADAPPQP
jgi:alanine dehydrogenase